jgi:predicted PurR-regulated permease PerM
VPDHPCPTEPSNVRTTALVTIAVVTATFALYFGREILVPIAFAILLNALFRPVVKGLEKTGLKAPYGAAIVVLTILAIFALGTWRLAAPIKNWLDAAPERFQAAEQKLQRLRAPVDQITSVAKKVEHVADGPTTAPSTSNPPASQGPTGTAGILGATQKVVAGIVEVIVLLYLLLAAGDLFLRKLIKVIPAWRDKQRAEQVVDESQRAIMRYLLVTAMINAGQAVVVGLTLWWLKLPGALLWALLCFVLEFIPYLGATVMIVLLSVMAFATFENTGHILLVPGSYLLITNLQNNVVSPLLYGQHLKLNPVAVLIGVIVWWFLWGVPGAFIAVPLVATIKIVADRVEPLKPIGEFLGE